MLYAFFCVDEVRVKRLENLYPNAYDQPTSSLVSRWGAEGYPPPPFVYDVEPRLRQSGESAPNWNTNALCWREKMYNPHVGSIAKTKKK